MLLTGIAALALAGCGGEAEKEEETIPAPSEMQGSWATACFLDSGSGMYSLKRITVSGNSYAWSQEMYGTNPICEGISLEVITSSSGIMTVGALGQLSGDGMWAYPIDSVNTSFTQAAYTHAMVDGFILTNHCGFSDWSLGVAKEILGIVDCGPEAGTVYYDVGVVVPNIPDDIFIQGDKSATGGMPPSDPLFRPTSLSTNPGDIFYRQTGT